jgi:hypothetical protein
MEKPKGKAPAGWYDAPEITGLEQFWNGKSWSSNKRIPGDEEGLQPLPEAIFYLGKFLFRKPYFQDNSFVAFLSINAFFAFSRVITNAQNGGFHTGPGAIFSGIGDAVIGTLAIGLVVWLFFLIYLIPRRIKDKKKHERKGMKRTRPDARQVVKSEKEFEKSESNLEEWRELFEKDLGKQRSATTPSSKPSNNGYKKSKRFYLNGSMAYTLACGHQIRSAKQVGMFSKGLLTKTVWCEICNENRTVTGTLDPWVR